ncbi:hypothetical protein LCGC14_1739120 [marine sediment metagenome]|uniref:DUF1064 domain-containing protein n=1 Tax=marine sediment metagenome TaxID=412755 RepID=A0A0F9HUW7_9ZZZZ
MIDLVRSGEISRLEVHPKWEIFVNGQKICTYTADFVYWENSNYVVEDVKSQPTMTPVYRLKKKMMKAVHGIEIQEIGIVKRTKRRSKVSAAGMA